MEVFIEGIRGMKGSNKILLSAVMMTLLSSTMAMPVTWAAAGINSDGRILQLLLIVNLKVQVIRLRMV